jgi:hypothetical protein
MNYQYTSTREIEQIISSLKSKNSHGYDDISVNILKSSSPYISSPLCPICNKMLSTGISPDRLKYAVVKLILKNGDKRVVSNYRPISLLRAFSKVLEKVIYVRMYQHLVNNSILINEQFGFKPKSSTTAAAYSLINEVLDALNSKKLVSGIFCDLKKAFDSVDHDILLSKLKFYGIRGKFNELITSYLKNRY